MINNSNQSHTYHQQIVDHDAIVRRMALPVMNIISKSHDDSTSKMEVSTFVCMIGRIHKRKYCVSGSAYSSMYVKFLQILFNT